MRKIFASGHLIIRIDCLRATVLLYDSGVRSKAALAEEQAQLR